MKQTEMQLRSGQTIDLTLIKPEGITPEDVAYSLGNLCRFNGHVRRYYSVAEHCVWAAHLLEEYGPSVQYAGLMHDGGEILHGDVATPLGRVLGYNFKLLKRDAQHAINTRFNVVDDCGETEKLVKWADTVLLHLEAQALMRVDDPVAKWGVPPVTLPAERPQFQCWTPDTAARNWLLCFNELREELWPSNV